MNNLRLIGPPSSIIDPDTILSLARQQEFSQVMVIGWSSKGDLFISGSHPSYKDIFWLLENAASTMRKDRDR